MTDTIEKTLNAADPKVRAIIDAGAQSGELTYDALNDLLGEMSLDEMETEELLELLEDRGIQVVDTVLESSAKASTALPEKERMSGEHDDLDDVLAALRGLEEAAGVEMIEDAGGEIEEDATEDAFRQYLNRMGQTPLLLPEEERRLALLSRDGSPGEVVKARQKLAEANLRLVVSVSKAYAGRTSLPFLDIMQEGNIGLMRAIERYDPDRHKRLASYATWWIRQSIGKALGEHTKSLRLPGQIYGTVQKIKRLRRELEQKFNREPSRAELAEASGLTISQIDDALRAVVKNVSLDSPVGESQDMELGEVVADENEESPAAAQNRGELRERLEVILDDLPERERVILTMRFGFGVYASSGPQAHEDIARELNLSSERVQEIEARALRKLRRRADESGLEMFFEDA